MNKILIECKNDAIRVKKILGIILLAILLFFVLFGYNPNRKQEEKKKEEKVEDSCTMLNENINDFNYLMSEANLCSENWINDVGDYIERLEDQNTYLKLKEGAAYINVLKHQETLLIDLESFKNKQDSNTIAQLEISFKSYKKLYDTSCNK